MKVVQIVECSDYDVTYGYFLIGDDVDCEEFEEAIYEAKHKAEAKYYDEWCLDDLIEELSESGIDFEWEAVRENDYVVGV